MLHRQLQAMPLPPPTDLLALLGIDLVLCAALLALLTRRGGLARPARRWGLLAFFVVMWMPAGTAALPLLAYVRGITSDLSMTLVALACLCLGQGLFGLPAVARRERLALWAVIAAGAALLYPAALGWGDWDAYQPGWGSWGMLAMLLLLSLGGSMAGLRLLPALIGLALLAWAGGLMESGNLWDYLMDPWLAMGAFAQSVKAGAAAFARRRGAVTKGGLPCP